MLDVGTRAPEFDTVDDQGEAVSLRDLLAPGPIVLYFYPSDFTPVCTRQACAFRDRSEELTRAGVRVFGVSSDGERQHAKFREKYSLPFRLLCDPKKRMARAYDVSTSFGVLPGRVSYLIGSDGHIQANASTSIRLGPHLDFIDQVLNRYPSSTGR